MSSELEFSPFHAPDPGSAGDEVELAVANPEYAEQQSAYRAGLELNPFAIDMTVEKLFPTFEHRAEDLIDADKLCIDSPRLTLVVGYPFRGQYAVTVEGSPIGFTRAQLFRQIQRVFTEMYDGSTSSPGKRTLQTRIDSPRFGTAWHRIDELAIEHIVVQKRADGVFAWISIGS